MTAPVNVNSYDDLVQALDQRRRELGWTLLDLNEYAGLHNGYSEKLKIQARRYGPVSLPLTLAALDLEIELAEIEGTA